VSSFPPNDSGASAPHHNNTVDHDTNGTFLLDPQRSPSDSAHHAPFRLFHKMLLNSTDGLVHPSTRPLPTPSLFMTMVSTFLLQPLNDKHSARLMFPPHRPFHHRPSTSSLHSFITCGFDA
jgi:hypothetical protein